MQNMHIRILRKLKIRTWVGFVTLAMMLSVLVGCATNGKVKPAKVSQKSFVAQGYSVVRFEDGRKGFIITEVPQMDEASRKDFEHAVAMLNDQDYSQAIDILEKVIEKSPGVTAPYIDIAIAYQHIGKPEKAEDHLIIRWQVMNTVCCVARPDDLTKPAGFMRRPSQAFRIIIPCTETSESSATCI